MQLDRRLGMAVALVFLVAGTAGVVCVSAAGSWDEPLQGDGPYYLGLARSMAAGRGYYLESSHWSGSPYMGTLPLWPVIVAPVIWLFPAFAPESVIRGMAVLMFAVSAVLLLVLTWYLSTSVGAALTAGLMYALYPPALALLQSAFSEPAFLAVATTGLLLTRHRRMSVQCAGALVSGLGVLCRSNYLVLPVILAIATAIVRPEYLREWRRWVILSAVFFVPVSLWVWRNYAVSGMFPVVNALEGETLYGANNVVVATQLDRWGYWVYPNEIPGEMQQIDVARKLTEAEQNRYYRQKAVQFFRENWYAYPRLILGKLIRGFVPVPFVFSLTSYAGSCFRWLFYALLVWTARRRIVLRDWYLCFVTAIFFIVLLTTVIFYGTFRFTLPAEVYAMPWIAAAIAEKSREIKDCLHSPKTDAKIF